MTREQALQLAAGKDDVELQAVGRKYGLLNLACAVDGVDPTAEPHTSDQFTRDNPFVHLAIREGHVQATKRDVSHLKRVKDPKSGREVEVHTSKAPEHDGGGELPIEQTVFKGE